MICLVLLGRYFEYCLVMCCLPQVMLQYQWTLQGKQIKSSVNYKMICISFQMGFRTQRS